MPFSTAIVLIVFVLIGVAMVGAFGLLVWVVLKGQLQSHSVNKPGDVSRALVAAGADPANPPPLPVGQWVARVHQPGSLMDLDGLTGTLRLESRRLTFSANDVQPPIIDLDTRSIVAGKTGMLEVPDVWLDSTQTGRLQLTVSHEHINVFMQNDFKSAREQRYADEFLWLLHHSGSRIIG